MVGTSLHQLLRLIGASESEKADQTWKAKPWLSKHLKFPRYAFTNEALLTHLKLPLKQLNGSITIVVRGHSSVGCILNSLLD